MSQVHPVIAGSTRNPFTNGYCIAYKDGYRVKPGMTNAMEQSKSEIL